MPHGEAMCRRGRRRSHSRALGAHGAVACRLRADDKVTFVEARQQDLAEIDRPDAIVDLVEADMMLFEGVGDEEHPTLEPEGARIAHEADLIVPGVFDGRQSLREGARGRADGRYTDAGGRPPSASCGRSTLYS